MRSITTTKIMGDYFVFVQDDKGRRHKIGEFTRGAAGPYVFADDNNVFALTGDELRNLAAALDGVN